jgi:hypothetical protein
VSISVVSPGAVFGLKFRDDFLICQKIAMNSIEGDTSAPPLPPLVPSRLISGFEKIRLMRTDAVQDRYDCDYIEIPVTALVNADGSPKVWAASIDNLTCQTGQATLKWGAYWCFGKVNMPVGVKGTFGQNVNGSFNTGLVATVLGTGADDTSFWQLDNTKRFGFFKFEVLPGYRVVV